VKRHSLATTRSRRKGRDSFQEHLSQYNVPGVINVIRKWYDKLYIGTSDGLALVESGVLRAAKFRDRPGGTLPLGGYG
jgi:hypothetical protein